MSIDPSKFHLYNVTDTCSVWNVLSSSTLYRRAIDAGVHFVCTGYVLYECLSKPRSSYSKTDSELCKRLRQIREKGLNFKDYPLEIEDLQTIEILENRKKLDKGELASLAFAMKTRQAFLTDDKKARKLGKEMLTSSSTQTTPHMLSWLIFENKATDIDKTTIIEEHKSMGRPLAKCFEVAYQEACRCRLMVEKGTSIQS